MPQLKDIFKADQKMLSYCMLSKETHFKYKDTCRLEVDTCRKICHANPNQKEAGVATIISDRVGLKTSKFIRAYEKGPNIMTKGSNLQEDRQFLMCMYLTIECQTIWRKN